jgi:uncharacterized protein (TIGR00266 family)
MQIEIVQKPGSAAAKLKLVKGESLYSDGGSLIALEGDFKVETTTYQKNKGGIIQGLKRLVAGQSFFLNHYTALPPSTNHTHSTIYLAPTLPGDVEVISLNQMAIIAEAGSFLAASSQISINVGWQGFKNFFSGESLFWLEMRGEGAVTVGAFGAIYCVEVDGEFFIDTGHIVAFEESLNFSLSKAGSSWLQSYLGGEGFVCHFKGRGKVWCQTHNASTFGESLTSHLKAS